MLSVIIITKNEEKYLPRLLNDISKQNFKDYEIIVADANSKDNTKNIAKKNGCKIVKGGHFSVGRNNGAKSAKGDFLLFIDADMTIKDRYFFSKIMKAFNNRKVNALSFKFHVENGAWGERVFFSLVNTFVHGCILMGIAAGRGGCQAFRKVKFPGYNEKMEMGEDIDILKRVHGFRFLDATVYESDRRYRKEGYIAVVMDWLKSFWYNAIIRRPYKKIRKNVR